MNFLRQCLLILFSEQHFFAGDDQILLLSSLLLAAASRWLVQCRSHVRIFTPKYIAPLHLLLRDDNLFSEVTNTTYFSFTVFKTKFLLKRCLIPCEIEKRVFGHKKSQKIEKVTKTNNGKIFNLFSLYCI